MSASTNQHTAKSTAAGQKRSPHSVVIDLCGDDDEPRQDRRRPRRDPPPAAVDAIVVDDDATTTEDQDPTSLYRRAVGPHRLAWVDDLPHHAFASLKHGRPRKLYHELVAYQLNLPVDPASAIAVRVQESRMDLVRAVITGPEGTPYANGCFFFDIGLQDYPQSPPKVTFLTTGGGKVRFNPNLYNCGKVCLSLLGTWSGPGWQPNQSTLLQVLVSLQGLILVADPYFNEPGYTRNQSGASAASHQYTLDIRRHTLQYALDDPLQHLRGKQSLGPATHFDDFVRAHLVQRANAIRQQLHEWVADDASLQSRATRVQRHLDDVVARAQQQQQQQQQEAAAAAAADRRRRRAAAEVVTID